VNLGTGIGSSVLDVVRAAVDAIGRDIPFEVGPRRAGDVVAAFADPTLAASLLDWRATRSLTEMCADHWRWQRDNPDGYRSA
jgi:UDP-glucose 4-epimerase